VAAARHGRLLGYCGPIEVHDRYCYFVDLEIVRYETLWLRPMSCTFSTLSRLLSVSAAGEA